MMSISNTLFVTFISTVIWLMIAFLIAAAIYVCGVWIDRAVRAWREARRPRHKVGRHDEAEAALRRVRAQDPEVDRLVREITAAAERWRTERDG